MKAWLITKKTTLKYLYSEEECWCKRCYKPTKDQLIAWRDAYFFDRDLRKNNPYDFRVKDKKPRAIFIHQHWRKCREKELQTCLEANIANGMESCFA